jgi:hypothetical protein
MPTTPYKGKFTHNQQQELLALLWDYLREDFDTEDRRSTGYGTKTTTGLLAGIETIVYSPRERS